MHGKVADASADEWLVPCEVSLPHIDSFLKVKETLTRIGIGNREKKILYQSCHILHKQGRYFVMSFKEMFALDGKLHSLQSEDLMRRNTIARLLGDWGLVAVLNPDDRQLPVSNMMIIPHKEKAHWQLVPKYSIGISQHKPK